jgi:DNA-binding GntR family transcriptional regulator
MAGRSVYRMAGRIVRWSETPFYEQLADIIRAQIRAGGIEPVDIDGEVARMLPSEKYLMDRYGLSRQTVRRALEVLRETGWIETLHRRGSRVRDDWPR